MSLKEIHSKAGNLFVDCPGMFNSYGILMPPPIAHRFRRIVKLANKAELHERRIVRQRQARHVLESANLLQGATANENCGRSYQGSAFSQHHVPRGRSYWIVEQNRMR